jgi:hypothetical protein
MRRSPARSGAVSGLNFAVRRATRGTAVDGIPEMLEYGEAEILVPPRDKKALASAIASLIHATLTLLSISAKYQLETFSNISVPTSTYAN